MASPLQNLQALLRRLFRLDEPRDLDFGIYRVINLKRDRLSEYIDNKLPEKIAETLNQSGSETRQAKVDELQHAREWVVKDLGPEALDADDNLAVPAFANTPAGGHYLRAQQDTLHIKPAKEMQEEIYDHLASFFARYECGGGDIVPQRRHSVRNRYALPHNGEEVLLHWANRDQYYIKTAALHSNIAFKADGKRFRFQITEAKDIPRDNNKDGGRFLFPQIAKAAKDDNGDIVVPFTFCTLNKDDQKRYAEAANGENGNGSKAQRGILAKAEEELNKAADNNPDLRPLLQSHAAQPEISIFSLHAARFVRRNNADFFIHRNLRKFLSEELDFYLKNEALNADELAGLNGFAVAARMVVFCAVREIAADIIDALAEWEDFQKSLWEKKKFVLQTEYCATLGHIPDAEKSGILKDIANCDKQWAEWEKMGINGEAVPLFSGKSKKEKRIAWLRETPSLPIDTANFPPEFKDCLLAQFPDIDDATDGVLIHGENWQVLNLIREMYRGQMKCIYIDPPYNSPSSEILYKNDFKHSSWLSMVENRISLSSELMTSDGVFICAIDENEMLHLGLALDCIFPPSGYEKNCLTVVHNPKGIQGGFVSVNNEYAFVVSRAGQVANTMPIPQEEWEWENFRNWGGESERHTAKNCFYPIVVKDGKIVDFGDVCADDYHPRQNEPGENGAIMVYPVDKDGIERKWTYALQSIHKIKHLLRVVKKNGGFDIERSHDWRRFKTVWNKKEYIAGDYGSKPLNQILGEKRFDFPKAIPFVMDCVRMSIDDRSIVLDYFAGSGTTAHAVMNLNREDGGRRKFILAEMGDYFNTVLLPRVKKIIYAPKWKDGKAIRPPTVEEFERGPRLVKYQRIESYEDTLANIQFESSELNLEKTQPRYQLNFESRGSPTRLLESGLDSPFSYALELTMGNGENGENTRTEMADLPETFAYMIGLRMRTRRIAMDRKRRYLVLQGMCDGRETAVIWRDTAGWEPADYDRDKDFIEKEGLMKGAERILINGDSAIKRAESLNPIFGAAMFSGTEEGGDV